MGMGFAFVGQSTAVLVINNYGPTLYAALGYGTRDQLALQCGWITVGIIFNAVGAAIMDRTGRKPLLLLGVAGCCACLIIEAAMVAQYAAAGTNKAGLGVGVAAFYVFLAFYSVGMLRPPHLVFEVKLLISSRRRRLRCRLLFRALPEPYSR